MHHELEEYNGKNMDPEPELFSELKFHYHLNFRELRERFVIVLYVDG